MRQLLKIAVFTLGVILAFSSVIRAGVRGHESKYVGGTVTGVEQGQTGEMHTEDNGLAFNADNKQHVEIPYNQITAMEYGEHTGRRVTAVLLSHKKRHYLTVYFNRDESKASDQREKIAKDPGLAPAGDVAAFEINKQDFADIINVLQAKTGLKVKQETVSH